MTRQPLYPRANATAQRFDDDWPSTKFTKIGKAVLHTEEIPVGWPGYAGGGNAPNISGNPDMRAKRIDWRIHFPAGQSSRALRNEAGGVLTNTEDDGVFQIELAGTCANYMVQKWARKGLTQNVDYIYWPGAPDWALRDLADLLAWLHIEWGLPITAPPPSRWPTYEDASRRRARNYRFTFTEWKRFRGICGHVHVPEQSHLDPGHIDIVKLLRFTLDAVARRTGNPFPAPPLPPTAAKPPAPAKRTRKVTVRKGQTLTGIAVAAGISLAAILALNPTLVDPSRLLPGQTITIPVTPTTKAPPRPPQPTPRVTRKPPATKPRPPATKPRPRATPRPVLRPGARGPAVRIVQRAVGVRADGNYGPRTRAAVVRFQARNGLRRDGIVGPSTWAKIRR